MSTNYSFQQIFTPIEQPADSITIGGITLDQHIKYPRIYISRTQPFIFANAKGEIIDQKPCIQHGANGDYISLRISGLPAHDLIVSQYIINDDPVHKTIVDHRNRIATDNRIENLRHVTPRLSNFNRIVDPRHYFVDHLSAQAFRVPEFDGNQLDDNEVHFWFDPSIDMLFVQTDVNAYRSFVLSSTNRFKTSAVDKTQVNMALSKLQHYND